MSKRKAPTFGDVVGYWPKSADKMRIPAIVCGVLEDKVGRIWLELRPQIPPSLVFMFRDDDKDFMEVPYGTPGQPGSWTYLDEIIPTPDMG